jgi:hypothetical protein
LPSDVGSKNVSIAEAQDVFRSFNITGGTTHHSEKAVA